MCSTSNCTGGAETWFRLQGRLRHGASPQEGQSNQGPARIVADSSSSAENEAHQRHGKIQIHANLTSDTSRANRCGHGGRDSDCTKKSRDLTPP
jgi:hypothetical protein